MVLTENELKGLFRIMIFINVIFYVSQSDISCGEYLGWGISGI